MNEHEIGWMARLLAPKRSPGGVAEADPAADGFKGTAIACALKATRLTKLQGLDAFRFLTLAMYGLENDLAPARVIAEQPSDDALVEWTGRAVFFTVSMAVDETGAVDPRLRDDARWALAQVGATPDGLAREDARGVRDVVAVDRLVELIDEVILKLWVDDGPSRN